MIDKILANPENWLPPVDQVDRPYFIALEHREYETRIYSEYTNLNVLQPVHSNNNSWYENVNKSTLQYFLIRGRFGYYWVDMHSGLIFLAAQHELSDEPLLLKHYVLGVEINDEMITQHFSGAKPFIPQPFELKHFKVNEQVGAPTSGGAVDIRDKTVMFGLNTTRSPDPPQVHSSVTHVVFGWEIKNHPLGHITFEGIVRNRVPGFNLRLIFTPHSSYMDQYIDLRLELWDVPNKTQRHIKHQVKYVGEKIIWEEAIM